MYFRQISINPVMAKAMLNKSAGNRLIREKRVKMLVSDMLSGHWTESPQPICFNKNGELIDGHHRLLAIVEAGTSVIMTVAYDVPQEAVIDKGLERDTGDALYMRGLISKEASKRGVIAVARRYLELAGNRNKIPDSQMADFLNENEKAILTAISLSRTGAHAVVCKKASIQSAIFGALKCGVPYEILFSFCSVCNTGFMQNESQSAAIVLRNYAIMQQSAANGASALNDLSMFAQMAIRDFSNGVSRKVRYTKLKNVYIPNLRTYEGKGESKC